MQNVFSPLLSIQQQQQNPMTSQMEQESPTNLDLQMLMSTLEAQQQQGGQTSSANNFPPQLFEALFSQAFSQTNQNQSSANNLHLSNLEQSHLASEHGSPPSQTQAEDISTVVSTPTSVAPPNLQATDEDAAKFMAQLLRDGPANLLQQLPGQSQPTSPNLQDASALLEQLQFMGMLNSAGNVNESQGEQSSEWKNAIANGALDLASLFSSQPFNFLNAAGQLNQQQRSTSSSSNDAFCDICNKQLCNRYFLRTHRLKKHNIIDPPSATQTPISAFPLHHLQGGLQSPLKRDGVDWGAFGVGSNEPSTPNRLLNDSNNQQQREMPFAQLADPPAKMPRLAPVSSSNGGREDQSPLKSPNQLNTPTHQQNISRFSCDSCDKEFDSMSSLLQHQLQNHQHSNPNFPPLLMQSLNGSINNAGENQTPLSSPSGHDTPHHQQQTPNSQQHTPSSGQNSSNMLNQLLPGLQLPPAFQLPPLFNFGNLPSAFPFGGSGNNELDMARMAQHLNASNDGRLPNIGAQANKTPKRQYTSTSKNYCQICNKEVCNKYFLRTHMLKMHNTIIDENKIVIANIDTIEKEKEGGLSFRCDYCKTNFDTRQQLREHKREIHNIAPATLSNGGATASSASSDCDATSKTPNSANANLSSFFAQNAQLHHDQIDPSSSASSTAGTAGSLLTSCQYCPETFMDNNKLSNHLVTNHYQELISEFAKAQNNMQSMDEDELINQVALQMARDNQMEKAKEHKNMTYKCTHCQREYTNANKFNEHLQLHISAKKFSPKKNKRKILTPQKLKKIRQAFTCTKCHKRFLNRIECQNHIANHLREEKLILGESQENVGPQTIIKCENGNTEVLNLDGIDEELLVVYMQEDSDCMQGMEDFRSSAVDEVVEQLHQNMQKRNNKEEKHSHTSGSASPSSTHMPEGFFHPLHTNTNSGSEKFSTAYRTQSFVMRIANENLDEEGNGTILQDICDQLVGTLPVRQQIHRPFRLTFDFQPLPEEEGNKMEVEESENIQTANI